jgi:hypothetical protein
VRVRPGAKPLSTFEAAAKGDRDSAIAAAFQSGENTKKRLSEHVGVHYSTLGSLVKK